MIDIEQYTGKRVHMIGIGGSSMSGLVDFLLTRGIRVTGSDRDNSHHVETLVTKGVPVMIGHRAENVRGADLIVFSAAIHPDNPERAEAKRLGIPEMERSTLLGELMRGAKTAICVSGTHGKTTTSGMIGQALTDAGLGFLTVTAGEDLGTDLERITSGTAADFCKQTFSGLSVLLAEAAPRSERRTPGLPDGEFVRAEKIPMTKQEVRAAALAKLAVRPTDVCWDIGAGTGSVSIELALQAKSVWAVERDEDAIRLAAENREKHGAPVCAARRASSFRRFESASPFTARAPAGGTAARAGAATAGIPAPQTGR